MPRHFQGEQLNLSNRSSIRLCHAHRKVNCQARSQFLAALRQRLLDQALAWRSCTTVLMLDLDFVRFEPAGPIRLLHLLEDRRADGVFGMSVADRRKCPSCLYDTGAVEASRLNRRRIAEGSIAVVESAFSGFGLYSAEALRRTHARYNTTALGLVVEHKPFNRQLLILLVNGSFRPVYSGKGRGLPGANNVSQLVSPGGTTVV
jgi:hypothetical protein